ncbi:MAG: type II toxin-antitoxin system VapC family toxin [Methylacidiphilaceae bacterium]|nr:type II toxin-antitoxin system VapC family toxin [Candidatus Methylacidiphilaceae bacterium]
MRLLLDTHVFLALIEERLVALPDAVERLLKDPRSEYYLSAAGVWEIAFQSRLGKLNLTPRLGSLPELLDGLGIQVVAIHERHAVATVEPEPATRDPFDRILLAQCQVEGLRLITVDRALASHPMAAKAD